MTEQLVVKEVKRPSFIKKKHDLDKLLKLLNKETEAAIKVLADVVNDDKADTRQRQDCAKTIIQFKISVAESINRDEMQRLIAEVKFDPTNGVKNLELEESGGRPVLDFNTIREV